MKKKYTFSIHFGLSTAIAFIVIVTSLFITTALFINIKAEMRQDLEKRMHDILAIGISKVDADAHATLINPEQEGDSVYNQIRANLQQIRNGSTGVRFVYTMRQITIDSLEFVVDAEENDSEKSHLGDKYKDDEISSFIKGPDSIFVSKVYTHDKWGTWLSGYVKIITSKGKTDGIIGLDISAQSVINHNRQVLSKIIIIEILITIVFVLLGIFISKRISHPLSLLEKDLNRIKDFSLDTSYVINSRFKEIDSIENTVDNMKTGLRSFKRYVPADLVKQLISLKNEAKLGGENKEMTVMFTDIENFTSISEKFTLDQITEYMSEYFEGLTNIIVKNNGTIDKYIGDSIMSFWGAPVDNEKHAYFACLTAIECQQYLKGINIKFSETGKPEFITRIGINSGEMIVGNFGYSERFNYTVLGDNVNLASRLEMINKYYHTHTIISDNTYQIVKDSFTCRKIDIVAVKGKDIGTPIYELIDLSKNLTLEQKSSIDLFNQGIDMYLNKEWKKALETFDEYHKIVACDIPSEILTKRCNEYIKTPPPDGWNGIFVLTEK